GAGTNYSTYLRKTDGAPAVNLGDGDGCALSPDGKWVLALLYTPSQLVLLPTGAGEPRRLDISGIETFDRPLKWSPNGKQVVFSGREPGHTWRSYFYDLRVRHPAPANERGSHGAHDLSGWQIVPGFGRQGEEVSSSHAGNGPAPGCWSER